MEKILEFNYDSFIKKIASEESANKLYDQARKLGWGRVLGVDASITPKQWQNILNVLKQHTKKPKDIQALRSLYVYIKNLLNGKYNDMGNNSSTEYWQSKGVTPGEIPQVQNLSEANLFSKEGPYALKENFKENLKKFL